MDKDLKNEYAQMPEEFGRKISSTLNTLEDKKNLTTFSRATKIIIAVAAIIALLTVSGFSSEEIYQNLLKKDNGKITLNLPENTNKEIIYLPEYVKLNLGWLPDDIEPFEPPYKYSRVYSDGTEASGGLSFALFTTKTALHYAAENAAGAKEMKIGDHFGAVLTFEDREFNRQLLIFFDEFDYVLLCYVHSDISDEELMKIAENISLEETDKEHSLSLQANIPGSVELSSIPYDPDNQIEIYEYYIAEGEEKYEYIKSLGYDEIAEEYKRDELDPLKERYIEYLKHPDESSE